MAGTTPANGDLIQIRTVCYTDQQIAMNVLHYQMVVQGVVPMDLETLAKALDARWFAAYMALMPTTANWRGVDAQNLMAPKTLNFPAIANTGQGTQGDNLAPTQSSYLISMRAPLAGRRYRGRIYPGFISTNNLGDNGALTVEIGRAHV